MESSVADSLGNLGRYFWMEFLFADFVQPAMPHGRAGGVWMAGKAREASDGDNCGAIGIVYAADQVYYFMYAGNVLL